MRTRVHADLSTGSRLEAIEHARRALLVGDRVDSVRIAPWVERSWQRCLQYGLMPQARAEFDVISVSLSRQTTEGNERLVQTAAPLLEKLGKAIVNTGYFAILTNHLGIVVDVNGSIDRSDRRADLITRIGTDLSEQRVGTTAIGTALSEQQPVWLHRGEHFFSNTSVYSCAGAPVFGASGACVGMLDVTGIDALERPELAHLVTQVAGKISNALVLAQSHSVLLRLTWPGNTLGSDADGLVCLDKDGWITGANPVARQMVPGMSANQTQLVHAEEVFGLPLHMIFDATKERQKTLEIPLWNGLQLHGTAVLAAHENAPSQHITRPQELAGVGLKDMETHMIIQAVVHAKGNVALAAQALGISRATVYRKLGKESRR